MVNQQLVDYIKQQLQAGVDKEMVRKTLSDAGWQAPDVDDSMKAAAPAAPSTPAASPAGSVSPSAGMGPAGMSSGPASSMSGASSMPGKPASEPAKIDPAAAMGGGASESMSSRNKFFSRPSAVSPAASPTSAVVDDDDDEEDHPSTKKFMMSMIVMGLVIVILAGALAFVYFNLNGQLEAARNGVMPSGGDQSALQQQVTELTAERDALAAQTAQAGAERDVLMSELGFFVVPSGASTSTPVTVTVSGVLTGNASTTFNLTTAHNVRVSVANSADATVSAALTPLADGATTVQLTGTHLPASAALTVTAVNGEAL